MSEQRIAFRRIHGRIVPIKLTQAQREGKVKLGAAEVAGGAAIGYYAGKTKGKLVEQAAYAERGARKIITEAASLIKKKGPKIPAEQMAFGFKEAIMPKGAVGAIGKFRHSNKLFKYAGATKLVGAAIAGSLITRGVTNIIEAGIGKETNEPTKFALDVGGGLATLGVQTGYLRRVGTAKKFKDALNMALKSKQFRMKFKPKKG